MTHFVDVDLDSLAHSYANDNRNPIAKLIQGCCEIWAAVLEEGFRSVDQAGWVGTRDFKLVCECAGASPEVMQVVGF